MKQKTEAQRDKIVAAAGRLFGARGYDSVSTADIAAEMGGSKATLYNYFPNKEAIFVAVMMAAARAQGKKAFCALGDSGPLPRKLQEFGSAYLQFILSKPMIDVKRRVLAQADKIAIGPAVYENGLKNGWQPVADLLATAMRAGQLRQGDPWQAAMQYKALLEAGLMDKRMLNVKVSITRPALQAAARQAFDVFWAYYGKGAKA